MLSALPRRRQILHQRNTRRRAAGVIVRADGRPVLGVNNSCRPQCGGKQSGEVFTVGAEDGIRATRRLDPKLGAIGCAEQRSPKVVRMPLRRTERDGQSGGGTGRVRDGRGRGRTRRLVALPHQHARLDEAGPDGRVERPARCGRGELCQSHGRDFGAERRAGIIPFAISDARPQSFLRRPGRQHVIVEHAFERSAARVWTRRTAPPGPRPLAPRCAPGPPPPGVSRA